MQTEELAIVLDSAARDFNRRYTNEVGSWDDLAEPGREQNREMARAAADALIPEGSVVVDRARFDRLLALADSAQRWHAAYNAGKDWSTSQFSGAELDLDAAIQALHPGDREPIP